MVFVGGCLAVLFEDSGKEDKVFKRCIEEGLRGEEPDLGNERCGKNFVVAIPSLRNEEFEMDDPSNMARLKTHVEAGFDAPRTRFQVVTVVALKADLSSINTPVSIRVGQRYGRSIVALGLVGDARSLRCGEAQPCFESIGHPGAVVVNADLYVDRDCVHLPLGLRFRVQAEGWDSFRKLGIVHPVRLIRNIGSCGAIVESTGVEKLQSYQKN